jgi:hypothetical protein
VLLDFPGVFLVYRLVRITPGPRVDEILLRLRLPRTLGARLLGGDRCQEGGAREQGRDNATKATHGKAAGHGERL